MRVVFYRHESGVENFGDALNFWLWDKLLPPAGTILRPDLLFYGVGTLLESPMPAGPKLIFGSGTGYGPAAKVDESWDVRFVRGPNTAAWLGLSPEKALTDPAILVAAMKERVPEASARYPVAFMPRFTDVEELREEAKTAGLHVIDPRWPVERVLDEIADSQFVASEALHGAIVADALRIPWLPVVYESGHEFKWKDWLAGLGMPYNPIEIGKRGTGVSSSTLRWLRNVANVKPGHLSDSKVFRALLLRVLKEVDCLRTEIRNRTGAFSPRYDVHAAAIPVKGVNSAN